MAEEKSRHWAAQAVQILRAVDLLARPQGASYEELEQELEIGRRTVFRLRQALEELGFPLVELDGDGRKIRFGLEEGYGRKLPNITVPEFRLTPAEILALTLLRGSAHPLRGSEIETRIDSAFRKLDALLPAGVAQRFAALGAVLLPARPGGKDYSGKEPIIELLCRGIVERHTCLVEYHAFGEDEIKRYRIDPLHFFEQDGGLYLFVRITRFGDIRILAVERIRELSISDESFVWPEDFDAAARLSGAFTIFVGEPVTVRVRFAADQARYIAERLWAKEQTLETNSDGSVTLTLTAGGWWDIKRWLLGFGAAAEVLEPEKLRQEIAKELRATMQWYEGRPK